MAVGGWGRGVAGLGGGEGGGGVGACWGGDYRGGVPALCLSIVKAVAVGPKNQTLGSEKLVQHVR